MKHTLAIILIITLISCAGTRHPQPQPEYRRTVINEPPPFTPVPGHNYTDQEWNEILKTQRRRSQQ